jgi:hypothetical protein
MIADASVQTSQRQGIPVRQISGEDRHAGFSVRETRRIGTDPSRVPIRWPDGRLSPSGAARPTPPWHEGVKAILIGFWGVLKVGWLDRMPECL